jgi:hypothetical protein
MKLMEDYVRAALKGEVEDISATDLKLHMGECLTQTSLGKTFCIKRKGKIVAFLVTPENSVPPENKVPTTLLECFEQLEALAADDIRSLMTMQEEDMCRFHHSMGQWIRNNWGLWKKDTELYDLLHNMGLAHADDMSGLILTSFHRHLHGKPLALEVQVAYYKQYWDKKGE